MRSGRNIIIGLVIIIFSASLTFASIINWRKGKWPGPWPKQLKEYRKQTLVVEVTEEIQETVFELEFKKREEFEKAWPQIISLKTTGAPLILEKNPSKYDVSGTTAQTGVRILWTSTNPVIMDDGSILRASSIDFTSIKSPTGQLPEYVVVKEGKWIPYDGKDQTATRHRARVDIVLITDANIVDLNRIPLPPDTPIIDRRFSK